MAEVIRTLIVDDHPLVRVGLSMVLGAYPDIEVAGEASDGAQAIEMVATLDPDLVLMDIRMPGMDGLTATERLLESGTRPAVIMLTTFDTDELVLRALRAGASGFLLKDSQPQQILESVRRVVAGESMLSPSVINRLIRHVVDGEADQRTHRNRRALADLTEREHTVAVAIADGHTNAEISAALYVSLATVKADVSRIFTKLGCSNRVQIAIMVNETRT
jgi:DNA-binding NarL/FixJ family response regulator